MAKVNTQSIPSELRVRYKRALQIETDTNGNAFVRTRFPWRLPQMQDGGADVKAAQKVQRDRFLYSKNHYALLNATDRARWAAANPEYHSYLFGYNFFMLEGLMGGGPTEFPQMIKSIQVVKASMAAAGTTGFVINAVDPLKCVVLIAGNSQKYANVQRGSDSLTDGGSNNHALSPSVDISVCEVIVDGGGGKMDVGEGSGSGDWASPYASALIAAQLTVSMIASLVTINVAYAWQVIEHVESTVYPVLVSIAAELVTMGWAIVPDKAADVSITVVEYL